MTKEGISNVAVDQSMARSALNFFSMSVSEMSLK